MEKDQVLLLFIFYVVDNLHQWTVPFGIHSAVCSSTTLSLGWLCDTCFLNQYKMGKMTLCGF